MSQPWFMGRDSPARHPCGPLCHLLCGQGARDDSSVPPGFRGYQPILKSWGPWFLRRALFLCPRVTSSQAALGRRGCALHHACPLRGAVWLGEGDPEGGEGDPGAS